MGGEFCFASFCKRRIAESSHILPEVQSECAKRGVLVVFRDQALRPGPRSPDR